MTTQSHSRANIMRATKPPLASQSLLTPPPSLDLHSSVITSKKMLVSRRCFHCRSQYTALLAVAAPQAKVVDITRNVLTAVSEA